MSARDNILQRLRAAPQGRGAAGARRACFLCGHPRGHAASTRAARIELFCEKMAFWHGEVVRVTHDNWPQKLREICAAKGVRSLLYGEASAHAEALKAAASPG
jgi:L-lactate utilization protein LutC